MPFSSESNASEPPWRSSTILLPTAKGVLLTAYADTEAAIQAINGVALDYYLLKPWDPPEEEFSRSSRISLVKKGSKTRGRTSAAMPGPITRASSGHIDLVRRLFFEGLPGGLLEPLTVGFESVYDNIIGRGTLPAPAGES